MNKVVLLTGASSGIGKETAKILAQNGYKVYAAMRKSLPLPDLESPNIKIIYLDITIDETMVEAVQDIISIEKKIDILINCAGYGEYGAIEDIPIESAKYQLDVNLFGVARLIQLVLPSMRENGTGKIINISSGGGKFSIPYGGWYHASKFALEALSDALRNEVKQFGIDVIIIEPGAIESEFTDTALSRLMENSEKSPYLKSVARINKSYLSIKNKRISPIVVVTLILSAIQAKKPKTRYVTDATLKMALFLKWLLSDKMFDKMIHRQLKY